MKLLGLTGDIACGKSTVGRMLEARGAHLIDSDLLVRELYAQPKFAQSVAQLFAGRVLESSLLAPDGSVDRAGLGRVVFGDADALRRLEEVVHPAVAALRAEKIAALEAVAPPAIVIEAVKLVESGHARNCDLVWWITCDRNVQMQRLMHKRGLDQTSALSRIAQQPSPEKKRALLGAVPLVTIANNGSLAELEERVEQEWRKCLRGANASTRSAA